MRRSGAACKDSFHSNYTNCLFSFITNFLEPFAYLLFCIALAIHYKARKQPATKALLIYYIAATILLVVGCLNVGKNNIWVYDLVALCTSVFIGFYFYHLLQAPGKKTTIVLLTFFYLAYALIRNITLPGVRLFDSIGYSIVSASVACYVFMYFHQLLKNVTGVSILGEFNFWLASVYLIYFVGSFIIFVSYYYLTNKILSTYTKEERHLMTALWGLHNVLLFVSAISLLTGCLWVTYRRKSV